jgi:hypothetical protein
VIQRKSEEKMFNRYLKIWVAEVHILVMKDIMENNDPYMYHIFPTTNE